MSLGGGQQTGGTVVGGPTPEAAYMSGQYMANAAQNAYQAAQSQTQMGIDMVREQYNNAFNDLKPYTQTGVQALDQLNQYMGLQAYDPGTAPVAPTVSQNDLINYIKSNTQQLMGGANGGFGAGNIYNEYTGYGAYTGQQEQSQANEATGVTGQVNNGAVRNANSENVTGLGILGPGQADIIKQYLQDQLNDPSNPLQADYQNQLQQYNYAKNLQNQYNAQGPLTPQQITDKLAQTPGYQFQLNQGLDAVQRAASASGNPNSGTTLQGLVNYASGQAQQTYGATLSRLAALAGSGQQAAGQQATGAQQLGQQLLGAQTQLGDTQANSLLAAGNAFSQANLAANQQYQVIGQQSSGGGGLGSLLGGAASLLGSNSSGGAGLMGLLSSRTLKEGNTSISKEEILKRVNELSIEKWKYKGIEQNHIGPYAEDFANKFGVGDGKTINMVDAIGILYSSVQALSKKLDMIEGKQHARF